MAETTSFFWTDRKERAFINLRHGGGHWRLEWGRRDPPGSEHYAQLGDHVTSDRDEAVRMLLKQVRALSDEQDEPARVQRRLQEALAEEQA